MIKATKGDRDRVIDILSESFDDNQSVNYIVKQDKRRKLRIRNLMAYSFDMCYLYGDVFLTPDKTGCALILLPDKKKNNLKSIWLDIKLAVSCIGISNLRKTMKRESEIKKLHSERLIYYLWFIGVDHTKQNTGIGSVLIKEVIEAAHAIQRPVYLETSTLKNVSWYEHFGFKTYHKLNLGYTVFFMRKE